MNLIQLIIKVVAASGLLYGYYYCFLRNRAFHRYNRFFLLTAAALAAASPFLVIPLHLQAPGEGETTLAKTLQVIAATGWNEAEAGGMGNSAWIKWLSWQNGTGLLYMAGLAAALTLFVRSLFYIRRIRKKYPSEQVNHIRLYDTAEPGAPFSFFRLVFWHRDIPFNTKQGQQIFRHELYHVQQKHSADIVFMELLCCIAWFNPFFHLIKKELKVLHEFLADGHIAHQHNRLDYAELLVMQAIRQKEAGLSHPFAHHPIKRRIMMLTSTNPLHRKSGFFSRAMVLPLLLLLLSAFALRPVRYAHNTVHPAARPVSVVIDAGHGGIDAGAIVDGINEKDITLSLAQQVKALAPEYNVRVIMTREKDELPGGGTNIQEALKKRVAITEAEKPDMYISFHVNLGPESSPGQPGFEAYIAGRREDKKAQLLASTLLQQLSSLYAIVPDIKKRTEKGIWVLERNPRPAVLLECGNLSLAADREFITNKDNQEKVARTILQGIVSYSKL